MKNFFAKTLVAALLLGSVYVLFLSFHKLEKGEMGVVEDIRTGSVVRVFHSKYEFVWQASIPAWFSVYKMPSERSAHLDIKVPLPELAGLKGDAYSLVVPVTVTYRVDAGRFQDYAALKEQGKDINRVVSRYLQGLFAREMDPNLSPYYRPEAFSNKEKLVQDIHARARTGLKLQGIELSKMELAGSLVLPTRQEYNEGLAYRNELRKLEEKNEKDLRLIQSKLRNEKLESEEFYARLNEVSKIIKKNPDILKYIYIDKISPNVRVILSPDGKSVPGMFEGEREEKTPVRKKDVDNLR